jgi:hypothetical protein
VKGATTTATGWDRAPVRCVDKSKFDLPSHYPIWKTTPLHLHPPVTRTTAPAGKETAKRFSTPCFFFFFWLRIGANFPRSPLARTEGTLSHCGIWSRGLPAIHLFICVKSPGCSRSVPRPFFAVLGFAVFSHSSRHSRWKRDCTKFDVPQPVIHEPLAATHNV